MEIVIIMFLTFAGIIGHDVNFENNKAEQCSELNVYQINDLQRDYCLAHGKAEQAEREIEAVEQEIAELNEFVK